MENTCIHDFEIPMLIDWLIDFLGKEKIENTLRKYNKSLSSSGKFYKEYFIKLRHPWLETLNNYLNEINVLDDLKLIGLVSDIYKLKQLNNSKYSSLPIKYSNRLLDLTNSWGYIFEIQTAWIYHSKKNKITWLEENKKNKPEFMVSNSELKFYVECKTIQPDKSRKIKRKDFYAFVDVFEKKIEPLRVTGNIDFIFNNNNFSDTYTNNLIVDQVIKYIENESLNGNIDIFDGKAIFSLRESNSIAINFIDMHKTFNNNKPDNAVGVIFAEKDGDYAFNPIIITCKSVSNDEYFKSIYDELKYASKKQLPSNILGVIHCFIPEISSFYGDMNRALYLISCKLFSSEKREHIAAINFTSDTRQIPYYYGCKIQNPSLLFRNTNCKYDELKEFDFLDELDAQLK